MAFGRSPKQKGEFWVLKHLMVSVELRPCLVNVTSYCTMGVIGSLNPLKMIHR